MMSCDTTKEYLSNYIEGSLDDFDRRGIEEHLAQCDQCNQTLKQIQFLTRRFQSTVPLKTSADFEKKLHARISSAVNEPANVFPIRKVIYGLSGAAAVAAASFIIVGNISTQPDSPVAPNMNMNQEIRVTQSPNSNTQNNIPVQHLQPRRQQDPVVQNKPEKQDSVKSDPARLDPERIKLVGQEK